MVCMMVVLNYLTAAAWFLVALRLVTFRRGQRHHRPLIAVMAWLTINGALYCSWAFATVDIATPHATIASFITSFYFAARTFMCGGNLVKMWPSHKNHRKLDNVLS